MSSDGLRPDAMVQKNLFIVGTAGCGKSTLTNAFLVWLQNQGYDAVTVNLDPGADSLPYDPDVDVRGWIKLNDIMREYGLGPNGAQVAAADLLALNIKKITDVTSQFVSDYVTIDTPGH